jgi:2-dehydropantoate 2-reductase
VKICVLGAGALGCAIGGTLAEAGEVVTLVNRSSAQVQAIQGEGLRLVDGRGEAVVRVQAATDCRGLAPVDLVIVLVKSFDTASAIAQAAPLIGPDTVVMSLQNGLGHEDILAEAVGRERVLAGKTYVGGVFLAPGRVQRGTVGKATLIGELDGRVTPRAQAIAAAFERAGLACSVSERIVGTMWDKLLINVATGAVSAISGLGYGELYRVAELEQTALAAVDEAMAVARAAGVSLTIPSAAEAWRLAAAGLASDFRTSMLQSLDKAAQPGGIAGSRAAGPLTEIDFINGAVVRHGARLGVPTPVNATLVACVKGIERRLQRQASPAPQAIPTET